MVVDRMMGNCGRLDKGKGVGGVVVVEINPDGDWGLRVVYLAGVADGLG